MAAVGVIIDPIECAETGCAVPGRLVAGWIGTREIHVVPIEDLQPHRVEECAGDPQIVLHVASDGFASWRVIHDSFDRRELDEEADSACMSGVPGCLLNEVNREVRLSLV